MLPGTGGTQRLTRLIGKSAAIEMLAEGRTMDFDEAHRLGIVNKVFDAPRRCQLGGRYDGWPHRGVSVQKGTTDTPGE